MIRKLLIRLLPLGTITVFGWAWAQPDAPLMRNGAYVLPPVTATPAAVVVAVETGSGESVGASLRRAGVDPIDAIRYQLSFARHLGATQASAGTRLQIERGTMSQKLRQARVQIDPDRYLLVRSVEGQWLEEVRWVPVREDTLVLYSAVDDHLYTAIQSLEHPTAKLSMEERFSIFDKLTDRIFATQIDFAREVRPGAQVEILYRRVTRPDGTARSAEVLAVKLNTGQRVLEAYRYISRNGEVGYFDPQGKSLSTGFLRAPVQFRKITSSFSTRRLHPILGRYRAHVGIDYAAIQGTPVVAVGEGTVLRAGWSGGYGKVIEIRHQSGYTTRYAHLHRYEKGIQPGRRIVKGEVIGYVGSTGLATGAHLHYEVRRNGVPIDPEEMHALPENPIHPRDRARFANVLASHQLAFQRYASESYFASRRDHEKTRG